MSAENVTIGLWIVQFLRDWSIPTFICTGILAIIALIAPYYNAQRLRKRNAPKLDIEFKNKDPYCRHEKTEEGLGPYYCHFVVVNSGLTQADDCEAALEIIWDWCGEKKNLEWQQRKNFIPVNLKWAAENAEKDFERACFKTIYPGRRKYFCDIGRVNQGQNEDKFAFELPRSFISQDNYLCPGRYRIQISVYSKNAAKVAKEFVVDWRGGWRKTQEEMQKRLRIKMLLGEMDCID